VWIGIASDMNVQDPLDADPLQHGLAAVRPFIAE
jgi:hypothetical protein